MRLMVQGACRGVKYTRGPLDLLAFSEHTSFVHVVDSRTYDRKQVCNLYKFSLPPNKGSIIHGETRCKILIDGNNKSYM
jgi:hypothetical protein